MTLAMDAGGSRSGAFDDDDLSKLLQYFGKTADDMQLSRCWDYATFPWSAVYRRVSQTVNGPLTLLLVVIGLSGNMYSVRMVRRFRMNKVMVYYLATLAWWDSCLLVCTFGYYGFEATLSSLGRHINSSARVTQLLHGPTMTSMTGSVWFVVIIATVRHAVVSNPLGDGIAKSRGWAKVICVAASVGAFVYSLPNYFEMRLEPCAKGSERRMQVAPTALRTNTLYQHLYRVGSYCIFVSILPFLVICLLSCRMILIVRRSRREHAALREGQARGRSDGHTTTMLLVLLAKFLVCYLLPAVLNVLEAISQSTSRFYFLIIADLSNLLVVVNSATNCLIYFRWRQVLTRSATAHCTTPATLMTVRGNREPTPTPTRSTTSAPPRLFTAAEALALRRAWTRAQLHCADTVGARVLAAALREQPQLAAFFGMASVVDAADLQQDGRLAGFSAMVNELLEQVVAAVLRDDGATERAAVLLRRAGEQHSKRGILFTADTWRAVHDSLLRQLAPHEQSACQLPIANGSTSPLVAKFAGFVVGGLKAGAPTANDCESDEEEVYFV